MANEASPHIPNVEIRDIIHLNITGLVNGDFTKRLYDNGVTASEPITVTEIASGDYYVALTPTAEGNYGYIVKYNNFVFTNEFPIRTALNNITAAQVWAHATAVSLIAAIAKVRQYLSNKLNRVFDTETTGTYTVYEDDDSTPAFTGTFSRTDRDED